MKFQMGTIKFSATLFLSFRRPHVLRLPRNISHFLPPTTRRDSRLTSKMMRMSPPMLIHPTILPKRLHPTRSGNVRRLHFITRKLRYKYFGGRVKRPNRARHLFQLIGVGHIYRDIFYKQLRTHFPKQVVGSADHPN